MRNVQAILEEAGAGFAGILRTDFFTWDMSRHPLVNAIRTKLFAPRPSPPNSGVQVSGFALREACFAVDAIAAVPARGPGDLAREIVNLRAADQAMSHYDLAARLGPYLFTGGFVPADARARRAVEGYADVPGAPAEVRAGALYRDSWEERIRSQAWFIHDAMVTFLAEQGAGLGDVVKLTAFLRDVTNLAGLDAVHRLFFPDGSPPLTVIPIERLGRDEFRLEVELTALPLREAPGSGEGGTRRRIELPGARGLAAHYAAAMQMGPLLFVGAQLPVLPETGRLVERPTDLPGDAPAAERSPAVEEAELPFLPQARMCFRNLAEVLAAARSSLGDVLSLGIFLTDRRDVPALDRILRETFPEAPPALTLVQVPALPIRGARLQVEAVALIFDPLAPGGPIGGEGRLTRVGI